MIVRTIHALIQLSGIILVLWTAYLGFQRTLSLHFNSETPFNRDRHALVGGAALTVLLCGLVIGIIIVSRSHGDHLLESIHGKGAIGILPFLFFGLISGFYLYLLPMRRKILPALHGFNNLIVLVMTLFQLVTGIYLYLNHLLKG